MAKRRRKPTPDLNREVANALGAATGIQIPKAKGLLVNDEAEARRKPTTSKAKAKGPRGEV